MKIIEVSGCLMGYNGSFLILHRKPDDEEGNKWGLPAGRLEKGEDKLTAVIREIEEETSYKAKKSEIKFKGTFTGEYNSNTTIKFHCFRMKLKKKPEVKFDPKEHTKFKWATVKELNKMKDLAWCFHEVLGKVYNLT
jgi:8-oxo-dGTP pyrophosphatase MutT (NUDIX family)